MKKLIILLLVALSFTSCERLLMPKKKSQKPTEVFNEVWDKMNKGYVYFDYKGINWDSVKQLYALNIVDTMIERALFDSCVSMLSILQDRDVRLDAGFATYYYDNSSLFKPNFNKSIIEKKYLLECERTGPMQYKVIDSVAYIYYGNFDEDISDAQIDAVIARLKQTGAKKGLILDVRNSVGSNTKNMFTLLKHMGLDSANYDYTVYLYQTKYKNGPGRDEFTEYAGSWMDKNDSKKFARHIRVLTNRAMYGIPSLFATSCKGFHTVKTMGDTTGGGGGLPSSYELSNGWVLSYTSSRIRSSDGYEIVDGVTPDTTIHMNAVDEALGNDTVIEAALFDLLN